MHQATQALLNSIVQAPLLIGDLPQAKQFDRALIEITETSETLNTDQKLGHLYEDTLSLALELSPHIKTIARNLQIFDDKKNTIGELDFIVLNKKQNIHIHLELGVKFYLAYQIENDWHFPGPNDRDNWPKKLARLQNHQLKLTHNPITYEMLKTRFGVETIETRQLIYGCLFTPIDHEGPSPKLEYMAPNGRTGHWLYAHQWDEYLKDHKDIYMIPKTLWPVLPDKSTKTLFKHMPAKDFINGFQEYGAMFTTAKCEATYFLAPDNWPATLKQTAKNDTTAKNS